MYQQLGNEIITSVSIKQCHRNKIMVMGLLSEDQCCPFWNVFCFTLWPQHLCGSKKPLSVLFQWHLLFLLICSNVHSLMALVCHAFHTLAVMYTNILGHLVSLGEREFFSPFSKHYHCWNSVALITWLYFLYPNGGSIKSYQYNAISGSGANLSQH